MGRSSREVADGHRSEIVEIAARQLKAQGIDGITVPGVMAEAGLTHGGFYRHFASKQDLANEGIKRAFENQGHRIDLVGARNTGDHRGGILDVTSFYLSDSHIQNPGTGCPIAALSGDVARSDADSPLRETFTQGFKDNVAAIASLGTDGGEVSDAQRAEALVVMASIVGASVLARATAGDPVSAEILAALRAAYTVAT